MEDETKIENSDSNQELFDPGKAEHIVQGLSGIKRKLPRKEWRRRQNTHLRRLLSPKNALQVLQELMPGEEPSNFKFKLELAAIDPFSDENVYSAELSVAGATYQGFGPNQKHASDAAAERAIREHILNKMSKEQRALRAAAAAKDSEDEVVEEEEVPMVQLVSLALHKLFAQWEDDGHKVPQLKALPCEPGDDGLYPFVSDTAVSPPARTPRTVPAGAATMHPCALLAYMRPDAQYRLEAVRGACPQTMTFVMGVDVDGQSFSGTASNKREARRLAARAACATLFDVECDEAPKN